MTQPLTPERFDAMSRPGPRILWTAPAIAQRIGTSPDFVRDKLANLPGSPVRQIGGRYCAIEADLLAFFRAQPTET